MQSPAATRPVLKLLAAGVWLLVGLALVATAVSWLELSQPLSCGLVAAGVGGGLAAWRLGFSRLSGRNRRRIEALYPGQDRVCVFAFQSFRGYAIIALMIGLGYGLRHAPIPHLWLAPLYLTLGLGLVLGGSFPA